MKKLLSVVLSVILLTALALPAFAGGAAVQPGDIIYFGSPDEGIGFDAAWRVLDPEHTNNGEAGMFLVSENLMAEGAYFRDEKEPEVNTYAGSDAKAWCAEFFESHFSEEEKAAILPTYKSDEAYAVIHDFGDSSSGDSSSGGEATVNFSAEENILNGDRVFLLSAEEASSEAYGFTDAESRLAGYKGTAASWWLRSPHDPSFPIDVGIVFYNGWLLDFYENQNDVFGTGKVCMRPAMNLDTSKITLRSVGEGEWEAELSGSEPAQHTYGARTEPAERSGMGWFTWIIIGAAAVLLLIIALVVFLIVRAVRRKRKNN